MQTFIKRCFVVGCFGAFGTLLNIGLDWHGTRAYVAIVLCLMVGVLIVQGLDDRTLDKFTSLLGFIALLALGYFSTASFITDGFSLWALGGDCVVAVALGLGLFLAWVHLTGSGRVQKIARRNLSY